VDDGVDLETDTAKILAGLALWRDEVARVFTGDAPATTEGAQLQHFVAACRLPREHFDALVDGVAMDAAGTRYATFADLEPYCHRVASAVGLICAEIFEYKQPAVLDYARDLGVALQLTNILRDVGVDYGTGRRYLPDEDLARFGCTWDDIGREVERGRRQSSGAPGAGIENRAVRAVLEHQAARARVFFSRAVRVLPKEDARRFLSAEIMRAVYYQLLERIEGAGFDVFPEVIRVPRPAQARLAVRTWWRTR
jgi:phytoene synthase